MAYNSNFVSTPVNDLLELHDLRWSHDETRQAHRSPFSKDRDRILYSKSFLRLRGKTQIFMLNKNDYIRTRLTHTLEVNQIAKSIGISLGLNVELIEAIALGHDVGHTPFGHVGERTLSELINDDPYVGDEAQGFKHNLQALRLFCELEKGADFPNSKGLNLTKYTLWGIAHHSSIPFRKDNDGNIIEPHVYAHPIYDMYLNSIDDYWSFEGYIVALADEIAQRHHDIEDGLRYGIIDRAELLNEIDRFHPLFGKQEKDCLRRLRTELWQLEEPVFNALFSRLVINLYVTNAINTTKQNIKNFEERFEIFKQQDFKDKKPRIVQENHKNIVSHSPEMQQYDSVFQEFLKNHILSSYQAQAMDGKAKYIVKKLYKAFADTPSQLPDTALYSFARFVNMDINASRAEILSHIDIIIKNDQIDHIGILHRCIADYIGGMTDQFAYDEFDRLYGTRI